MEKTKNVLLILVFGVCFLLLGASSVSAWNFKEQDLVCENQTALEPGKTTNCYYIGKHSGASSDPNYGFVVQAYSTDSLYITGATVNESLKNEANAHFVESSSSNETSKNYFEGVAQVPTELTSNWYCPVVIKNSAVHPTTQGCGVYFTRSNQSAGAFDPDKMKKSDTPGLSQSVSEAMGNDSTLLVLGALKVKLDEKNESEKCGNICTKAYQVPTNAEWSNYMDCTTVPATGGTTTGGVECQHNTSSTSPIHAPEEGFDCREIHMKKKTEPGNNPGTGAFASYALLAAGALIAISAITIAKKNNKLQKI